MNQTVNTFIPRPEKDSEAGSLIKDGVEENILFLKRLIMTKVKNFLFAKLNMVRANIFAGSLAVFIGAASPPYVGALCSQFCS